MKNWNTFGRSDNRNSPREFGTSKILRQSENLVLILFSSLSLVLYRLFNKKKQSTKISTFWDTVDNNYQLNNISLQMKQILNYQVISFYSMFRARIKLNDKKKNFTYI